MTIIFQEELPNIWLNLFATEDMLMVNFVALLYLITSKLPYGYRRNPKDKNEWIVDETASQVVKEIFDMYLNQSLGMKVIARLLNERKIVSPDSHRMLLKGINVDEDKLYRWCGATVVKIIRRREYVGDTVNFRTEITSYKNKKVI